MKSLNAIVKTIKFGLLAFGLINGIEMVAMQQQPTFQAWIRLVSTNEFKPIMVKYDPQSRTCIAADLYKAAYNAFKESLDRHYDFTLIERNRTRIPNSSRPYSIDNLINDNPDDLSKSIFMQVEEMGG